MRTLKIPEFSMNTWIQGYPGGLASTEYPLCIKQLNPSLYLILVYTCITNSLM